VFNQAVFNGLDNRHSYATIGPCDDHRTEEVGVTVVDGYVTTFSFGLPLKWTQLVYLAPTERLLFQTIASEPHRRRQFGFEILNEVIERGGKIKAHLPTEVELAEIDTSKDIRRALQIS
jgi:hypothetical protein